MSEAAYEVLKSDRVGSSSLRPAVATTVSSSTRRRSSPCPTAGFERLVDDVLIVVAAQRTPQKLVEEAVAAVDRQKVIGLVFNGDDRR
jgi:hypothetical protein